MAFIVRPVRPNVAFISGAWSAISCPYLGVLVFFKIPGQISGQKPRHAGSGPPILTALKRKEKLKILIAEIELLDKEAKRKS
jgi:hypothetical protein